MVVDICFAENPGSPQPQDDVGIVRRDLFGGPQQDVLWLDPETLTPAIATFA
jgi:hypothetical protein